MRIEVDQSGKIEQLNKDSVIAFSNKNQYSVFIPKELKQEAFRLYKGKIRGNRRPNRILSLKEIEKCLKKR